MSFKVSSLAVGQGTKQACIDIWCCLKSKACRSGMQLKCKSRDLLNETVMCWVIYPGGWPPTEAQGSDLKAKPTPCNATTAAQSTACGVTRQSTIRTGVICIASQMASWWVKKTSQSSGNRWTPPTEIGQQGIDQRIIRTQWFYNETDTLSTASADQFYLTKFLTACTFHGTWPHA